ncbi:multiheme c-type cytochrome [Gemmata massiliana]|uniref:multiheme c-type cytochrome n=1 Tax=Gemmata massiliana TaxID=1210884 RepID=UPI0013A6CA51|nr:multiheme c-type cytochrome [Gemmata massiliana]
MNPNRQAIGMSGCLAAACHGGSASEALKGTRGGNCWESSGSCWAAADPHTAAYSLLTDNPRRPLKITAAKIMAKYAPGKQATEDARCLACHTNPALAREELIRDANARVLREQGVSCEACHGNASVWLQPHTTEEWGRNRAKVYAETGMKPLYDLGERALACAGCHVGAPAENGLPVRDMNHDMIAAGHPRLNFDFAEYQRRLPQHWQEKDRTKSSYSPIVPNEAKVWFVGRVAHAEAACKLLEDRAKRSLDPNEHRTPWPEFAEFNCASCHHNLRIPGESEKYGDWRKSAEYIGERPPGVPPWQMIWPVTDGVGLASPPWTQALLPVVRAMESPRPAKADKAQGVAKAAVGQIGNLRRELVSLPGEQVEARARGLFPRGALNLPEWDSATQLFFGLVALEYARGKPSDAVVKKYRSGVTAFRDQDWERLESAFKAIHEK